MNALVERWNASPLRPVYLSARGWAWWLFKKTGSLAWILGTTLVIVGFPIVLEIEREQQLIDLENQQRQPGFGGALPYTPVVPQAPVQTQAQPQAASS